MTDKLQTLMREQADSVDFAAPDLDAMIRTGDRRRRTRSAAAVVGVAAASVLAVAGVQAVVPEPTTRVQPMAPTTPDTAPVSWVMGSVLHEGDRSTSLPFRPVAYVATGEGYVFSDGDGTVWSMVGGSATEAGRTDAADPHLVADAESGLAGWLDPTTGSWVVLDQVTGSHDVHPARPGAAPEHFIGIDGGAAYWRAGRGLVGTTTGDRRPAVHPRAGAAKDVEEGLVSVPVAGGTEVRRLAGDVVMELPGLSGAFHDFSHDARYLTFEGDRPEVADLTTGDQVSLRLDGDQWATGYTWLGPRTLAVLAADGPEDDAVAGLWTCEVPAGDCDRVAELGTFLEIASELVLPTGARIDG